MDKLGSYMQTKHLCVLIHIGTNSDVDTGLSPPVILLVAVERRCFFCGFFNVFVFVFCDACL